MIQKFEKGKQKTKKRRDRNTDGLGFADELGNGGGDFRENGGSVSGLEAHVSGDVQTRHRFGNPCSSRLALQL